MAVSIMLMILSLRVADKTTKGDQHNPGVHLNFACILQYHLVVQRLALGVKGPTMKTSEMQAFSASETMNKPNECSRSAFRDASSKNHFKAGEGEIKRETSP